MAPENRGGRKWSGRTGGGTFGQRFILGLLRVTDVRVGYAILAVVVPFYMLFGRRGYRAIYGYFRQRVGYGPWRAFAKTYRNHFLFGQMMLDRFAIYAGRGGFAIEVDNAAAFERLVEGERGFIVCGSHTGNFEIAGYLLRQERKRINGIIFGGEAAEVQAQRSRVLGANNVRLVPVKEDMSHLFIVKAALEAGEIVSLACDRLLGSSKSVRCNLLGAPADFPAGGFRIAAQTGVEMVAVFVMKSAWNRYRVYVRPLEAGGCAETSPRLRAEALAHSFAAELESVLRQYPEQWFNFYDFWCAGTEENRYGAERLPDGETNILK